MWLGNALTAYFSMSVSPHSFLSPSLKKIWLTKRKMLSSFLLAHARGTRRMITGGFTTHVVARSTTMVSSKLYNTCGRLEEYQEHEAVWDIWSISMHHGRREQEYYDGHMWLHTQSIIGGGYNIMRVARSKRPCKRGFWSVQISIHQHNTNNTKYL